MRILVNGQTSEFEARVTIRDVVAATTEVREGRGLAVALNGEVVPRYRWEDTPVDDGDRVEVLRAVGGG